MCKVLSSQVVQKFLPSTVFVEGKQVARATSSVVFFYSECFIMFFSSSSQGTECSYRNHMNSVVGCQINDEDYTP